MAGELALDKEMLEELCQDAFNLDFSVPPLQIQTPDEDEDDPTAKDSDAQNINTLLKLPPELRLEVYSYILSTVRVSPYATTSQLPLLQICRVIRHEATEVYFARLDEIDRKARERYEEIQQRLTKAKPMGFRVGAYLEHSRFRRDDVLNLTKEMREVTAGVEDEKEDEKHAQLWTVLGVWLMRLLLCLLLLVGTKLASD